MIHLLCINSLLSQAPYGAIPPQPHPGAIHVPGPPGQFMQYHAVPPPPHPVMVPMPMPTYSYPPGPHPGVLPPGPPPPGPGQPMGAPYGMYPIPADYPTQGRQNL